MCMCVQSGKASGRSGSVFYVRSIRCYSTYGESLVLCEVYHFCDYAFHHKILQASIPTRNQYNMCVNCLWIGLHGNYAEYNFGMDKLCPKN